MSPKKKTKLQRKKKSRANRTNKKKQFQRAQAVIEVLNRLEQEDTAE